MQKVRNKFFTYLFFKQLTFITIKLLIILLIFNYH